MGKISRSNTGILDVSIQFHPDLNPALWQNGKMIPEVRQHLLQVAYAFEKFLELPDIEIEDITVSGSNAAYTYTSYSDIDLHIIVNVKDRQQKFMRKYFDTKKNLFNEHHSITINDQPVEVYVQFMNQPHSSAGIFSIAHNRWVQKPQRIKSSVDHDEVREKLMYYIRLIHNALVLKSGDKLDKILKKIVKLRKAGLEKEGEWGSDNIVFKILRNNEIIDQLNKMKTQLQDQELSLEEEQNELRTRNENRPG